MKSVFAKLWNNFCHVFNLKANHFPVLSAIQTELRVDFPLESIPTQEKVLSDEKPQKLDWAMVCSKICSIIPRKTVPSWFPAVLTQGSSKKQTILIGISHVGGEIFPKPI